jgi:methyltransferase-like protein
MTDATREIQKTYDDVPYYSFPYGQTTPEHLAAVAHVFGLDTPDVRTARVLELGCAAGGNLVPFAARNPGARVVGVDLSGIQIDDGRRRIERLQLTNIELLQQDLTTLTKDFGEFDYIIAHGVYSWVPEHVQDAILRISRENLSNDGIAYFGYKTYPGWKSREIVRDAMLLRAGDRQAGRERLSYGRGMVEFLQKHAKRETVLAHAIEQDAGMIRSFDAAYVIHDYLETMNAPCYFREFAARAVAHGLAYLGDAEPATMFAANYGSDVAKPLLDECGHDQVLLEQYLDFVTDRAFRRSLLVRKERAGEIAYQLQDARMRQLHVAALLKCADGAVRLDGEPQRFDAANGNLVVLDSSAAKLAAEALARAWPFTVSFDELHRIARTHVPEAEADADIDAQLITLFNTIVIRGVGRFRLQPVARRAENPSIDAVARDYPSDLPEGQAAHTFTAWHEPVVLDVVARYLLPHLDGSRTRADLLTMLTKAADDGTLAGDSETLAAELDRVLTLLCA